MSDPFDFDAFIRGTSLARRVVSAYRVDHRDEIARLTAEHDALPVEDGDERETSTVGAKRHEIAERIAALRAEMEASRVEWVLRTLTPEEFRALPEREYPKDATDTQRALVDVQRFEDVLDMVATMSRAPVGAVNPSLYNDLPNLTADQWRQISVVLGVSQWGRLVEQANALILSKVAVPDFSRSVSETLSPPAPSES